MTPRRNPNDGQDIMAGDPGPRTPEKTWKERYYRLAKALPIADVMQASGLTSREAAMGNAQDWTMAAQAAGYANYTPSDETQKVIIQLLLDREMAANKFVKGEACQAK